MSKKKKKSGKVIRMPQSPENYIRSRARKLPIHKCLINDVWQESGMATIIISRIHTSGYVTFGVYLVDLFCLGVKDTVYQFNIPGFEFDQYINEFSDHEKLISCDYVLAHNIIYGSIEFADEFEFLPHKDFTNVTKYILEEDDENVDLMDIEFGKNGKPFVVAEIGNEPVNVISQLEKTAGPGNFEVIYIDENGFGHDYFDDEDDFDEELFDEDLFDDLSGEQLNLFEDEFEKNDVPIGDEPDYPEDLENEEWTRLFTLMQQLYELKPWKWMTEAHMFAIKDPETDTIGYVSMMGELGEHTAVAVYFGNEGIHGYRVLQNLAQKIDMQTFMEIPHIQASFEDRDLLDDKDRKRIKQLGFKFRGKGAWPLIRSFHPGYWPWFPEPWERKFLCHVLEQTLEMAQRVKENPEMLYFDDSYKFLIRIPDVKKDSITWKDDVINAPSDFERKLPFIIDEDILFHIRALSEGNQKLELDLIQLPSPVRDNNARPYFAYLLIAVDVRTELIVFNKMMTPVPTLIDMYSYIPSYFVDMINSLGVMPGKVFIKNGVLVNLLKPLANDFKIPLKLVDNLTIIESVKEELFGYMD